MPLQWHTVEEELDLCGVFNGQYEHQIILLDCLTLWVGNVLHHRRDNPPEESEMAELCSQWLAAIEAQTGDLIVVTNEVGMGIVPENPLARLYRDLLGALQPVAGGKGPSGGVDGFRHPCLGEKRPEREGLMKWDEPVASRRTGRTLGSKNRTAQL